MSVGGGGGRDSYLWEGLRELEERSVNDVRLGCPEMALVDQAPECRSYRGADSGICPEGNCFVYVVRECHGWLFLWLRVVRDDSGSGRWLWWSG